MASGNHTTKNQRVKTVYLLCNNFVEVIFASFRLFGFQVLVLCMYKAIYTPPHTLYFNTVTRFIHQYYICITI